MNQLPQSPTAEAAAISLLTENPKLWDRYPWQEDLFTTPATRCAFRLMQQVRAKGGDAEKLAVLSEAQITNMSPEDMIAVVGVMNESAGQDMNYYFRTLVEIRARRKTIATALMGAEKLGRNEISPVEFSAEVADAASTPFVEKKSTADHIRTLIDDIENQTEPEVFATGHRLLDVRWPLRRGCLGVVAGPTSGGKSVLLCMAALQAVLEDRRVYFISLEMTEPEVLQRIIANAINHLALDLNCCVLTASQLNDDGRLRESRAIGQHADNVLTIVADEDKPGFSIDKVRNGQARVFVPAQLHGKVSRFE
jgi:replicative DNA helicase